MRGTDIKQGAKQQLTALGYIGRLLSLRTMAKFLYESFGDGADEYSAYAGSAQVCWADWFIYLQQAPVLAIALTVFFNNNRHLFASAHASTLFRKFSLMQRILHTLFSTDLTPYGVLMGEWAHTEEICH